MVHLCVYYSSTGHYWWSICVSIAAVPVRLLPVHLCVYYSNIRQTIDDPSLCLLQQYWSGYGRAISVSLTALTLRLLTVHLCAYCSSTVQTIDSPPVCLLQQYRSDYRWSIKNQWHLPLEILKYPSFYKIILDLRATSGGSSTPTFQRITPYPSGFWC